MAPVWSRLRTVNQQLSLQNVVVASSLAVTCFATFRAVTWDNSKRKKRPIEDLHLHLTEAKKDIAAVDSKFFRRLSRIIKILIPRLDCPEVRKTRGKITVTQNRKELQVMSHLQYLSILENQRDLTLNGKTGFMILIAVSLVLRTLCDVWMISKTTCLESDIVSRDRKAFFRDLLKFLTGLPVVSIVNQMLKYGLSELKLRFRTRLSLNLNEHYLSGFTYYKMSNLDNRIANPDQLLTEDIDKFCGSIVDLYSNVSKPILDIMIYVRRLTGAIGASGPVAMISYLAAAGLVLTRLRKPIGKMTVEEQKLEGEFRHVNSRIITNSEEIAFYQGNKREQQTVKKSFWRLIDHLRDLLNFRCSVGIIDNIIAKYLATVVGLLVVGTSFVNPDNKRLNGLSHSQLMEHYYETGRMMIRLAEAIGRLVLAGRDMSRLSGFTSRVTNLMDVLQDVKEGKYVRTMINQKSEDPALDNVKREKMDIARRNGTIIEQDYVIRFEDVPLVTPNGDVLVESMTFEVHSGKNVLVCGPNGCGKSSLFRVLGELWPLYGGVLTKPHRSQLFYVPQKPYMTVGTFRDQIIYPDSVGDMRVKGYTDQDIEEFVRQVHLEYILEREGWDTIQDWIDVLSGGEKQRVAMARMFYHQPQFAILDECTSAVSVDVEGFMYTRCREAGITLFTVSHRKSLWKYHEYVLYMDGRGSYSFTRKEDATTDFGS